MSTRPFVDTFRQIESGILLDELSERQQELIKAVQLTNKKAVLTITLNYTPEGQGQVSIEADVKAKAPKMSRGRSIFFVTPDANLERNDPRQSELDLRSVDDERPTEFKKVI